MLQVREVEMGDVAGGNTFTCSATGVEDATATLTVQGEYNCIQNLYWVIKMCSMNII